MQEEGFYAKTTQMVDYTCVFRSNLILDTHEFHQDNHMQAITVQDLPFSIMAFDNVLLFPSL